jgi:menaquinone-dependent protoporphyrinogen oxidase
MGTRVLVAFASKHGSTGEIAEAIGEELRSLGSEVDVRPAAEVADVLHYDAFVVGSAVYNGRWRGEARSLLKRLERECPARATWLFSSGPTGGSPEADAAVEAARRASSSAAPQDIVRAVRRIAVQGHVTFTGKVGDAATGVLERFVPRGDWRDFEQVAAWARSIDGALNKVHRP